MYHIADVNKDVYARYVDGVLTWVEVQAINRVDATSPDYANAYQWKTPAESLPTSNLTVDGPTLTIPENGWVWPYIRYQCTAVTTATYVRPYWRIYINGKEVYSGISIMRDPTFFTVNMQPFKVRAGDTIQVDCNPNTATANVSYDNGGLYMIPEKGGLAGDAVSTMNDHIANTAVHVTQGDKDNWNAGIVTSPTKTVVGTYTPPTGGASVPRYRQTFAFTTPANGTTDMEIELGFTPSKCWIVDGILLGKSDAETEAGDIFHYPLGYTNLQEIIGFHAKYGDSKLHIFANGFTSIPGEITIEFID
jgi:hypothetical protein